MRHRRIFIRADSGQRTVDVMEPHGSHSIHIDFCVSHQLRKFFVGHHLAQQPGIDPSTFQKRHGFIGQVQFRQRGVDLLRFSVRQNR